MTARARGVRVAAVCAALAPGVAAAQDPPTDFAWEPFGYLRVQYLTVQNDPNVASVGRDDGFEIQNARLGARGHLGSVAAFVISFDGAIDDRTLVTSPQQDKLAVGLRDTYVETSLAGPMVVRVGYFQCWLDPQAQVPDTARELVDLPIETRGMRQSEGYQAVGLPPGRSIGAAIRLDPPVPVEGANLGFELAAQNSADEFSNNNDNDRVAASAAGIVRFPHDGWIVAAGRWNPRVVGAIPSPQNETDLQGALGAHMSAGPVSLEGGLIVQHTSFETTGAASQDAYGGHAQAMVRLPIDRPLAVGYRFGVLDPDNRVAIDRVIEHTIGAVLGMPALHMRIQLQVVHVVEQAAHDLANDRAQLAVELVL